MIKLKVNRKLLILFFLFLTITVISAIVVNFKRRSVLGTITSSSSPEIIVSATIGERRLTIFGWAPVQSQIKLDGVAVYDATTAASDGSFLISGIYLPNTSTYPEICLQAQDTEGRTTQPTCLPRLAVGQYNYTVGPVLLSPTLSLEKGEIIKGDQVAAQGKTTPNTEVDIFLAREKSASTGLLSLVKTAWAYNIPKYQIKSDKAGNFEFNLPTEAVAKWRVFAGANIAGNISPKSNTLVFKVHSPLYSFWEILKRLFGLLRPYLIYIVIFIEVVILSLLLLKRHRHSLR